MDPGYSLRHEATRRGLRVVLELTATGGGSTLARVAGRAAEEIRDLLSVPGPPVLQGRRRGIAPRPD